MSQWRSWSMGQGGYVCAVLLAPNLCFVDLPAEANPTRILPYHVHAPPHPPPCRALWITRARFHRRQMRQSWASTMVFAASRPLPNGNTWDESQQEHGPRQCTVLCCACCMYPDHWVGPSTTHTPFQAPATDHLHQVPLPHQQKTPSRIRAAGRILSLVHDRGLPQLTQFRRPRTTGRSRPWSATSPSGAKGRGEYHQVSAAAYGTLPLH